MTNEYINPFFPVAIAHWLLIHDGEQETSGSRGHTDDVRARFQNLPLKNPLLGTVNIVKPCIGTL